MLSPVFHKTSERLSCEQCPFGCGDLSLIDIMTSWQNEDTMLETISIQKQNNPVHEQFDCHTSFNAIYFCINFYCQRAGVYLSQVLWVLQHPQFFDILLPSARFSTSNGKILLTLSICNIKILNTPLKHVKLQLREKAVE